MPGAVRYVLWTQVVDVSEWEPLGGGNLQATSFRHRDLSARPRPTATRSAALTPTARSWARGRTTPTVTVPTADAATATATATPTSGPTPTPTPTASTSSAPVLTARYAGANGIELSWTAVSGADRYVLFTQLVAERGWQQLDEGNLTATTYLHREFTPGATYQYAVRAVDANGQPLGPWSNFPTVTVPTADAATATATPTAGPTPTPTPTASTSSAPVLTATYSGANEVELSWAAVSGADRYVLWTQVVDASEWERLDRNNLHDTSFRHRDLTPRRDLPLRSARRGRQRPMAGPVVELPDGDRAGVDRKGRAGRALRGHRRRQLGAQRQLAERQAALFLAWRHQPTPAVA